MWHDKTVQVIFPAYNEDENIKHAIEDFYATEFVDEVIVVDNNSTDKTKEEIQKTKAKYVFEGTPGYGSALTAGLKASDADIVITAEPDGTFIGRDIIKLLVYSVDFDVVFGTRTSRVCIWQGANMNWFLRIGNVAVAKMMEYLFNAPCLTDVGCTMKLIKREQLDKIINKFKVKNSHFSPEFMMHALMHKFDIIEIPVNYGPRKGASKITGSFWKAFRLGWRMIFFILWTRVKFFFRKPK